eukprot:gene28993-32185_t
MVRSGSSTGFDLGTTSSSNTYSGPRINSNPYTSSTNSNSTTSSCPKISSFNSCSSNFNPSSICLSKPPQSQKSTPSTIPSTAIGVRDHDGTHLANQADWDTLERTLHQPASMPEEIAMPESVVIKEEVAMLIGVVIKEENDIVEENIMGSVPTDLMTLEDSISKMKTEVGGMYRSAPLHEIEDAAVGEGAHEYGSILAMMLWRLAQAPLMRPLKLTQSLALGQWRLVQSFTLGTMRLPPSNSPRALEGGPITRAGGQVAVQARIGFCDRALNDGPYGGDEFLTADTWYTTVQLACIPYATPASRSA